MNSASANLRFGDGVLAFEDFRVTRDEGIGTGAFAYDSGRNEVRLTNVETTLKPGEAIMWIEPRFWEQVAPYRFHRTPHVTANGVVQFGAGKQTHLQIDVDAPSGMDYTFIDKVLPFDRIAGQLLFTDDRLQILGLKATLFSGSVTGGADISLAKGDPHYTAQIAVEKADFPSLTDLYFKYKTSQGALSGSFDFAGLGGDARFLKGEGNVEVTEGNVFAIPIFGPLSELLNKMFAGAGYSVAHEATAPFTIKSGVIHTDKLKVVGQLVLHARARRYQFSPEQTRLRYPDRRRRAGRGADAALQTLRIPRRRQPNETDLAAETVLMAAPSGAAERIC